MRQTRERHEQRERLRHERDARVIAEMTPFVGDLFKDEQPPGNEFIHLLELTTT